jgi:hypothetical protein
MEFKERWIRGTMRLDGISLELAGLRWTIIERSIQVRGYRFLKPRKVKAEIQEKNHQLQKQQFQH